MKKVVRYGIIGIGKMGSIHAVKFKMKAIKNATLTAVCDIDPERRLWAESKLDGVKIFEDYIQLIASGVVDAIIVATPHYLHPIIAIEAMHHGVHVLIEKPAGVFAASVRELNEVAEEHPDVGFAIMYNQRTNKLYRYAKEIIETGRLGALKRINWIITDWYRPQAYYNQGGWRGTWAGEGGGALINQCPHQLDLFQWLGGMPRSVRAIVQNGVNRDISVENDVTAMFRYDGNQTGVFITSTHDSPGTNRLEIDGDRGKIVIENDKLVFQELMCGEAEFSQKNKKFMPKIPSRKILRVLHPHEKFNMLMGGQHVEIIRNFTNHILFGEKLYAPGIEGIKGLQLSNAIHLAGWLNREIQIPADEDLFVAELDKRIEEEKQKQQLAEAEQSDSESLKNQ